MRSTSGATSRPLSHVVVLGPPGVFHRPPEVILSPSLERRFLSTANYVNVPMSPAVAESRRALLNMELRLNTPGPYPASRPPSAPRGNHLTLTAPDELAVALRG